uniref:non-specific serine/threonine protein kinase n=1 Tax=Knipowitschia caucasica TaxID=637954 RepID=A0AAV2KE47_KNICA
MQIICGITVRNGIHMHRETLCQGNLRTGVVRRGWSPHQTGLTALVQREVSRSRTSEDRHDSELSEDPEPAPAPAPALAQSSWRSRKRKSDALSEVEITRKRQFKTHWITSKIDTTEQALHKANRKLQTLAKKVMPRRKSPAKVKPSKLAPVQREVWDFGGPTRILSQNCVRIRSRPQLLPQLWSSHHGAAANTAVICCPKWRFKTLWITLKIDTTEQEGRNEEQDAVPDSNVGTDSAQSPSAQSPSGEPPSAHPLPSTSTGSLRKYLVGTRCQYGSLDMNLQTGDKPGMTSIQRREDNFAVVIKWVPIKSVRFVLETINGRMMRIPQEAVMLSQMNEIPLNMIPSFTPALLDWTDEIKEIYAKVLFRRSLMSACLLEENRIFQRDIKPENFLFLQEGNRTFRDFAGTMEFQCPEHFRCQLQTPTAVTVWQMGCVLFLMLWKRTPLEPEQIVKRRCVPIPEDSIQGPKKVQFGDFSQGTEEVQFGDHSQGPEEVQFGDLSQGTEEVQFEDHSQGPEEVQFEDLS